MRIDWRRDGGPICLVVDLDSGQRLTPLAMADDATGEYVLYATKPDGTFDCDLYGRPYTRRPQQGRIKIFVLFDRESNGG